VIIFNFDHPRHTLQNCSRNIVESGVKHHAINQHLYFSCLFKGVPQLVLLTKIDRVCEITGKDLSRFKFMLVVYNKTETDIIKCTV
jgi:hypothetical protein